MFSYLLQLQGDIIAIRGNVTQREDQLLKDMYGKKMFEQYMNVLASPDAFEQTAKCFKCSCKKHASRRKAPDTVPY